MSERLARHLLKRLNRKAMAPAVADAIEAGILCQEDVESHGQVVAAAAEGLGVLRCAQGPALFLSSLLFKGGPGLALGHPSAEQETAESEYRPQDHGDRIHPVTPHSLIARPTPDPGARFPLSPIRGDLTR